MDNETIGRPTDDYHHGGTEDKYSPRSVWTESKPSTGMKPEDRGFIYDPLLNAYVRKWETNEGKEWTLEYVYEDKIVMWDMNGVKFYETPRGESYV